MTLEIQIIALKRYKIEAPGKLSNCDVRVSISRLSLLRLDTLQMQQGHSRSSGRAAYTQVACQRQWLAYFDCACNLDSSFSKEPDLIAASD